MTQPTPPIPGSFGPMQPPDPNIRKKTNILVWILLGFAGIVVAGGLALVGGAYYVVKSVAVPGNALKTIANVVTTINPDLEVISMDGDTVKVRVKSTGDEAEVKLSDLQNGKIDVKTRDGRVVVNGKGRTPDWLPKYPAVKGEPITQVEIRSEEKGTLVFHTDDATERVISFYESELKKAGFGISSKSAVEGDDGAIRIKAESGARSVQVTSTSRGDWTIVTLIYSLPSN